MELPNVQATVALPIDKRGRIGLSRKKQAIHHDSGEISYSLGLYNGYGGKREAVDETIWHTAKREAEDEGKVKIDLKHLHRVARVYFYVPDKERGGHIPFMDVTFFFLKQWEGEFEETSEMGPIEWFGKYELPEKDMMPADGELLRRIFSGERAEYEVKLNGKHMPYDIRIVRPLFIPLHIQAYVLFLTAWKRIF